MKKFPVLRIITQTIPRVVSCPRDTGTAGGCGMTWPPDLKTPEPGEDFIEMERRTR